MNELRRIATLDGLRGLAILMVLGFHLRGNFAEAMTAAGWSRWEAKLVSPLSYGAAGVDLFFVLSGFLITGILWRARSSPGYFRVFYAKRALRIFPAYYAMLALAVFVLPLVPWWGRAGTDGMVRESWLAFAYVSNVGDSIAGRWLLDATDGSWGVSHVWSLAIEEQFYLLWPLVIYCLGRRAAMWACGVAFFGSLAFRSALILGGAGHLAAYTLLPSRLDALAAGSWVALFAAGPAGIAPLVRAAKVVGSLSLALFIGLVATARDFATRMAGVDTVGMSLLALAFAAAVVVAVDVKPSSAIGRLLGSRLLGRFGKYSYGIYLWHGVLYPVFDRLNLLIPIGPPIVARVSAALLCFGVPVAMAYAMGWLSFHVVERPFVRMKDRLSYGSRFRTTSSGRSDLAAASSHH